MKTEYAIIDDLGQLFGLPVRTWPTQEAAFLTLEYLEQRREELRHEAEEAAQRLAGDTHDMSPAELSGLADTLGRWEANKDRRYKVQVREVTEWRDL